MSNWVVYDHGKSIGTVSAEGGAILFDEEHPDGARITFKRGTGYISVSINIYGWMDHTRFFTSDSEAQREYKTMKSAVMVVLHTIRTAGVKDIRIWEAISEFVRRFP